MIVGDSSVLAIESELQTAYARLSFLGLGYFVVHVGGWVFGVRESGATMLACSYDRVSERLMRRGQHVVAFSGEPDAEAIAAAFRDVFYREQPREEHFGMAMEDFAAALHHAEIQWAPDGDEAFDDGSYILQFDVEDRVRLIAFRSAADDGVEAGSVRDVWISANSFYSTLERWAEAFIEEWKKMPKADMN